MKKSLLAVAVAAALPALALAQSNVTMYGILDANIEYANDDFAQTQLPAGTAAGTGEAHVRLNQGLQSGSRLGFRGVEDIGGGLKGIFTIEHRLNLDTAEVTQGAKFWGGQAWVGLEGGWGRATLGRQYTPLFWALLPADFTGYAFYNNWAGGSPFVPTTGGASTVQGPIRLDNQLAYRSPTMGGFTVYAAYAFGEVPNVDTAGTPAAGFAGNDIYGVAATWQLGGFYLGGGYHKVQDVRTGTGAPACFFEDVAAATVSYKTAGWGLSLGYSMLGFSGTGEVENLLASAFLSLGGGSLVANVIQIEPTGFAGTTNDSALQWGLAYHRPISKRTNWYVAYGANDLSPLAAPGAATLDPMRAAVGVRHLF
jgi:predicted porin